MAIFNAKLSTVYFDGITAYGATTGALGDSFGWTTADPFHAITAFGSGFTYSGSLPTGGTVTDIVFDWVDDDHPAGQQDATITGLSVPLANLVNGISPSAGQTQFWETVLAGNDTIIAADTAGGRFFGDFQNVLTNGFDSIFKQGGDDVFSVDATTRPGLLASRGDGAAANALIGDAQYVQGEEAGPFALFADVVGGDDTFNVSGQPLYFVIGDVQTAGFLSSVTGGDDVINSSMKFITMLGLGRTAQYTGDVEQSIGVVIGGDDAITGSNFAFATEIISGDVARMYENAILTGGADTILGRGGQEMVGGDAGLISATGSSTKGGADLIRGGGDSDILAGDVLMFDTNSSTAVLAVVTGGDDRIFGDAGDDWISGDVWEITNASGASQITGGNDRLSGGDGDDQLFGDVGTEFTGLTTADFLTGGNDILDGGLGNDLLNGQGGIDTASFASLALAVTVNLGGGTASGQGADTLMFIENVIGSSKADTITGDGGGNRLAGGDGKDTISGRAGADIIVGGAGADVLAGDGGADIYDYNVLADSGITATTRDVITGWDNADRVDVSSIDANTTKAGIQHFAFVGEAAPGKGEFGVSAIAGGVLLLFNTDADADAEMTIEIQTALAFGVGDFIV